ncbi:Tyrosine recombinase XerC [hydrothermal vent metagenome]|uniref:Tyrosine recombinase XerC n=1 Tax=hydrothermal vent metagenome TaxID=652676 RepID=A0A1W1BR70_9ZZZZ
MIRSDFIDGLIDSFLSYISDIRGYSETSVLTYKIVLRETFKVSEFYEDGDRWVLDITLYRIEIASNNKKTIAKKLSAIHSFVSYLENQREMSIKLIADESVKVPQTLPKPIEERYILEVLNDSTIEERTIVLLLYGLGLRISELSSIKLELLKEEWLEVRGKGGKVRQLPMLPIIHRSIELYKKSYNPKIYLFEKRGVAMSDSQLRYILTKCFKSKGIKATPHQLRHSFATHLLNSGARISDVSELLGHTTMATTQIYTKLAESKKLKEYQESHPLMRS